MSGLFGGSSEPDYYPTPAAPPLANDDARLKEAAKLQAEALRKRKGRLSTILTGPEGVLEQAPVEKKTLLGA
jgi:hypothetical protein